MSCLSCLSCWSCITTTTNMVIQLEAKLKKFEEILKRVEDLQSSIVTLHLETLQELPAIVATPLPSPKP